MGAIDRVFFWLLRKLAWALLLGALGVIGVGLGLFLADQGDFDLRRLEAVRTLTGETARLKTALVGVAARMAGTRVEVAAQQERAAQAAKVAGELDALSSGLNRLTTASVQLRENDERRGRMRQMEADSRKRVGELEQGLVRAQWEKDGMEIALGRTQQQLAGATAGTSVVRHYAREAWTSGGKTIMAVVALVMIGPALWRRRRRAR